MHSRSQHSLRKLVSFRGSHLGSLRLLSVMHKSRLWVMTPGHAGGRLRKERKWDWECWPGLTILM
jgi:hypothetical protein